MAPLARSGALPYLQHPFYELFAAQVLLGDCSNQAIGKCGRTGINRLQIAAIAANTPIPIRTGCHNAEYVA